MDCEREIFCESCGKLYIIQTHKHRYEYRESKITKGKCSICLKKEV